MELNKIHNINFLENTLSDKCANLIIADPPYFEVKGDFDFIWDSFDDYLKDVEKWAIECKRLLTDNGTLFWYGHAKKIAYSQVILDEHFELINNLVWEKTDCQTKKGIDDFRMFAPTTERILMYSNDNDLSFIMNDQTLFKSIRNYFLQEKAKCSLSFKEINETCFNSASNGGGMASNILTADKDGWSFPTQEKYEALQKIGICQKPYIDIKMEYDYLKAEYESLRRPFQNSKKLTDVLRFSQQANITGNYDHETCKPEHLTRTLILTCSRPNDLVVVPFAGSGTECAMAVKECRKTIGFEITEKHAKMSNERVQNILRQPSLFVGS